MAVIFIGGGRNRSTRSRFWLSCLHPLVLLLPIVLCIQCLSPLMLWVRIGIRTRCTTLCDKVCQRLATGRWFSSGPVSSTNKNWPPRYNWNIVEGGVKHHQTNNQTIICLTNHSLLYVPDEGYPRNVSCALSLISTFLLIII